MIAFFMMLRHPKDGPSEAPQSTYHHRRAAVVVKSSGEMEDLTFSSRFSKDTGESVKDSTDN